MAIRTNGSGDYIRRTTSLPAGDAITVAVWCKLAQIRSAYQYWGLENAASNSSSYTLTGFSSGGTMEIVEDDSNNQFASQPTANNWFFWAFTMGSGNGNFKGYWGYPTTATLITCAANDNPMTPAALTIGNDSYDEWMDATWAHVKVWDAVLSAAELEQERWTIRPQRLANLHLWTPLWSTADLNDYSGNGRNWTAGGTLATEDGPPLSWGAPVWIVPPLVTGAAGISGTLAATLADATVSAAGAIAIHGTATPTLAAATLTSAAKVALAGALTGTLADATISAAGTLAATGSGTLTATLADATLSAAGTVAIKGTLTVTLADATVSSAAKVALTGTLTKTLDAATISAAGSAGNTGTLTKTLADATCSAKGFHLSGVCLASAPLTVDTSNSRYVNDGTGPILLAGPHTWYAYIDGGVGNPAPTFDWDTWDAKLVDVGANFERAWIGYESPLDWPDESGTRFAPLPWARTGPGTATDGYPKFDLSKVAHEFLERVEERVILAGNSGRWLSLVLFQGWQGDLKGLSPGNPVANHAFASANNINGMNGNADADSDILEIYDTSNTAALAFQHAYIDAVLARLNRYPHITWEICNEMTATATTTAWQHHMVDYIKTAEASMTFQHLVVMSHQWPNGDNADDLYTSNADMVSIGGNDNTALSAPVVWPDTGATGFVGAMDTDHHGGLSPAPGWVQKALCQGYGALLLMDSWDGEFGDDWTADATIDEMRYNLGYMVEYAARIRLADAAPNGALASTGYCLAVTTGRQQFIVYQPSSGSCTLNLTGYAGTFSVEYLRPSTGATSTGSTVAGNGTRTLNSPWSGEDYVAFVELSAVSGTLTKTLDAATVSATGTLGATASGSLTATLADATVSSAGAVAIKGTATATLADATFTSTGALAITATSTTTLAAATVTSTATLANTGALAATLASATLAATGATGAFAVGALTATLADATVSSTATLALAGATSATLDAATLTSAAALANTGALTATLASATVVAVGVEVVIVSIVTGSIRGAGASGTVHGAGTSGTVRA